MYEHQEISLHHDLTFEWVAAFLAEVFNIPITQVNAKPLGIFSRYVRRDIEEIKLVKSDGSDNLFFQLNREGFYDALPEYLFHQSRDHKYFKTSGESILSEIEKGREIEESIRNFFLIFEEELLRSNIRIQQYENGVRKIDFGILKKVLLDFFIPFDWTAFSAKEQAKLLIYLPLVHQNIGIRNLEYYEELIRYFFDLNVTISYFREEYTVDLSSINKGMGSQNISWDFSLGSSTTMTRKVFQAEIYPTSESDFENFIRDTNLSEKFKHIFDWILPYDVVFRLKKELVPGGIKGVNIGQDELSYLGYVKM